MIEIKIKKGGVVSNSARFADQELADAWLVSQKAINAFGKNERWVHEDDISVFGEDKMQALSSEEVGGPDENKKRYYFAAEYTVESEDITAEIQRQETNRASLKLLAETDWYVIRFLESGVAVPQEVTEARAAARLAYQHDPA